MVHSSIICAASITAYALKIRRCLCVSMLYTNFAKPARTKIWNRLVKCWSIPSYEHLKALYSFVSNENTRINKLAMVIADKRTISFIYITQLDNFFSHNIERRQIAIVDWLFLYIQSLQICRHVVITCVWWAWWCFPHSFSAAIQDADQIWAATGNGRHCKQITDECECLFYS